MVELDRQMEKRKLEGRNTYQGWFLPDRYKEGQESEGEYLKNNDQKHQNRAVTEEGKLLHAKKKEPMVTDASIIHTGKDLK